MGKFLRGLLIMCAAVTVSLGASSFSAEAGSLKTDDIILDYSWQRLRIYALNGTTDTKFYMATSTVTTNKTTGIVTLKTAAATEYEIAKDGMVTMDLSPYAVTKDNYVSIWGNMNTDPILIKFPAKVKKMRATVNAMDATVKVEEISDKNNPVDITDYMDYCTTNGSWDAYAVERSALWNDNNGDGYADLDTYANLGATLRFRLGASMECSLDETITLGKDKDGNAISCYVASGNFASNEIKVKIPKTAAGPKATIDYNLRTVKIPANSEFRFNDLENLMNWDSSFVKASDVVDLKPSVTIKSNVVIISIDELLGIGVNTVFGFDLRTAADVTKKKPASKITEYRFRGGTTPVVVDRDGAPVKESYEGDAATVDEVAVGAKSDVVSYNNPYVKFHSFVYNKAKTRITAVKFENLLKGVMDKYQVVVSWEPVDLNASANVKIAATLNPGKVTQVPVTGGQYVYIRKIGNAREGIFSTPYVFLGVVPAFVQ